MGACICKRKKKSTENFDVPRSDAAQPCSSAEQTRDSLKSLNDVANGTAVKAAMSTASATDIDVRSSTLQAMANTQPQSETIALSQLQSLCSTENRYD